MSAVTSNASPAHAGAAEASVPAVRDPGIDRLKVGLTWLVVCHHAAISQGAVGGWYWRERAPDGSVVVTLLTAFCAVNQSFFMGLFFLMAGAYLRAGVAARGRCGFLLERLQRLGLPLMAFGWVLGPLTMAVAEAGHGGSFMGTWHWAMARHVFEPGPLWFAGLLLAMSSIAAFVPTGSAPLAFPSNARLLTAAVACGIVSFAVRLEWPAGRTLWFVQPAYLTGYIMLFASGIAWRGEHAWTRIPAAAARLWRRVAWCTLPLLAAVPHLPGDAMGGWSAAALLYAMWEPFVAWGIVLTLLHRAQSDAHPTGPIGRALARRAFGTFLLHAPVLVAVSVVLQGAPLPSLVKAGLSALVTCVACFALTGWLLRLPVLRRML